MGTPRHLRGPAALTLAALAAVSAAAPAMGAPIVAAQDTTQIDTASVATIRAYGRRLEFDTALGAADAQPLVVRRGRRSVWAKIEPRRNAYQLDTTALASGAIVARISAQSAYPLLHLGRGNNWWWIDKKGGRWRSIMYSEALNGKVEARISSITLHPGNQWQQSLARFFLADTSVAIWITLKGGCIPFDSLTQATRRLERPEPWRTEGPLHRP